MCISPLKGIVLGVNQDTGKNIIRVVSKNYDFRDNDIVIPIPCGKCIECRLDYSRTWADRMMAEASYYENNSFLTLTYDNEHLPPKKENSPVNSLVKRDFQLFIKRLRKANPDVKIRYYGCGEYGDESMRPHYHIILFNYAPTDCKLLFRRDGLEYYTSNSIAALWTYGNHIITKVTWDTCAYVARYVTKKLKNGYDDMPNKLNYEKEFSLMSRKPGIGYRFFEDNVKSFIDSGYSYISTDKGARKIKTNKYYSHLFDIEYPDIDYCRKELVKDRAKNSFKVVNKITGLSYNKINSNRAINLDAKTNYFARKEI